MMKEIRRNVAVYWKTPNNNLAVRMYKTDDQFHSMEPKIRYFKYFVHASKCIHKLYETPVFCKKDIDLTKHLNRIHEITKTELEKA